MSRSLKKGPYVDLRLLAKVEKQGIEQGADQDLVARLHRSSRSSSARRSWSTTARSS